MNSVLSSNFYSNQLVIAIFLSCIGAFSIYLLGIKSLIIFIGIIILVLTIYKPYWGLCLLIAFIPLEGLFAYNRVFTLMKVYGIIILISSLPIILMQRLKEVKIDKLTIVYLLFVIWSISSYFWSANISANITKNITYISLLILYFLIILLPEDNKNILHLVCFVIGSFLSLITIPVSSTLINDPAARFTGGGLNANDYAATLAIALPLSLVWIQSEKRAWIKLVPIAFVPLGLLGIAYTKSRGGTVALIPFSIYLFLILKKERWVGKILLLILLAASVLMLYYIAPIGYFERISELSIQSSDRFSKRLDIWIAGLRIFLDNPLLGIGSGNFHFYVNKYSNIYFTHSQGIGDVAHNAFISVAAELGIIGIVLFLILLGSHFKKNVILMRQENNPHIEIISSGLFYSFCAYLIASLSLTWEYRKVFPFLLGAIILLSRHKKHASDT